MEQNMKRHIIERHGEQVLKEIHFPYDLFPRKLRDNIGRKWRVKSGLRPKNSDVSEDESPAVEEASQSSSPKLSQRSAEEGVYPTLDCPDGSLASYSRPQQRQAEGDLAHEPAPARQLPGVSTFSYFNMLPLSAHPLPLTPSSVQAFQAGLHAPVVSLPFLCLGAAPFAGVLPDGLPMMGGFPLVSPTAFPWIPRPSGAVVPAYAGQDGVSLRSPTPSVPSSNLSSSPASSGQKENACFRGAAVSEGRAHGNIAEVDRTVRASSEVHQRVDASGKHKRKRYSSGSTPDRSSLGNVVPVSVLDLQDAPKKVRGQKEASLDSENSRSARVDRRDDRPFHAFAHFSSVDLTLDLQLHE
mmetsp:Transcript_20603/g.52967  ORF Transcript_20603/g.52967 Transcript_20603/m.52967 type:complete len:355 (-) Transcript_20603:711-1775(-)